MLLGDVAVRPLPVEHLEDALQPADAALDRHEVELREACADAAEEQVREAVLVVEECERAAAREVGLRPHDPAASFAMSLMSPEPMWKLIERPASCVAAQTGSQCSWASGGWPKVSGRLPKSTARCPFAADRSISLTDASTSQKGRASHRQQPVRVGARPVDEEVVVGLHALEHQLRAPEPKEATRSEAAEVRVEDHRVDALFVHQLRAARWRRRTPRGCRRSPSGTFGYVSSCPAIV